jgi:3-oxoacyl-[acyl-carrier-protein] synthase II
MMQSSRRVVITGIGIVSPLATGVEAAWQSLLAGKSAVAPLNLAELAAPYAAAAVSALPVKVAARVRRGASPHEFDLANYVSDAQVLGALRVSGTDSTHFAIGAAAQALRQADWLQRPGEPVDELDDTCPSVRTGVALGVGGVGSMSDISTASSVMRDRGYSRVSAYFLPRILPNMVAGQVALHFGLRGPMHSSSAACATGAQCIGDAYHAILRGDADVMVAGGADASIDPLSMAGFVRCRALSGSDSLEASRPFHPKRDGFVMVSVSLHLIVFESLASLCFFCCQGEGAAVLILEDFEHAVRRRAPHIIAEVLGYVLIKRSPVYFQ